MYPGDEACFRNTLHKGDDDNGDDNDDDDDEDDDDGDGDDDDNNNNNNNNVQSRRAVWVLLGTAYHMTNRLQEIDSSSICASRLCKHK